MRVTVWLVAFLWLAVPAFAVDGPAPGIYKSQFGDIMEGFFSESWVDAPHQEGLVHNTIHAWDASQGVQWKVYCPSIGVVTLVFDSRDASGNGFVQYSTDYVGGTLWLSKTGLWGHNEIDFTATIDVFNVVSTHLYAGWVQVSVVSDIRFNGHFDPPVEGQCFDYVLLNGYIEGTTGLGMSLPAGYPPFLDYYNCPAGTVAWGAWGLAEDITLYIYGDCTVATKESTWGKIKALYSD
jgi:hypothetical protein